MSFKKQIVIMSGAGSTGLVKLSGSFDGVNKVKGECRCETAAEGAKLYVIADDVTEIAIYPQKTTFEVPIAAKNDLSCLFTSGGKTLVGSTNGRADRRQLEGRIELFKRDRARAAAEQRASERRMREAREEKEREFARAALTADEKPRTEGQAPLSRAAAPGQTGAPLSSAEPPAAPFSPTASAGAGTVYDGTNFYQAVKPQIDELFVRYPAEDGLNTVVPNSKWVRVDTEDGFYVIGVLYDMSSPIFVCYGVPGVRTSGPPKEIADVCVWLPLDPRRSDGEGFWVIYQSAADGKCVT